MKMRQDNKNDDENKNEDENRKFVARGCRSEILSLYDTEAKFQNVEANINTQNQKT